MSAGSRYLPTSLDSADKPRKVGGRQKKSNIALNEQNRLREDAYQTECEVTADFIIQLAKKSGVKKLLMPAFGVGIYICALNNDDQNTATRIMNQAFAKAAKQHALHVEWVIYNKDKKIFLSRKYSDVTHLQRIFNTVQRV